MLQVVFALFKNETNHNRVILSVVVRGLPSPFHFSTFPGDKYFFRPYQLGSRGKVVHTDFYNVNRFEVKPQSIFSLPAWAGEGRQYALPSLSSLTTFLTWTPSPWSIPWAQMVFSWMHSQEDTICASCTPAVERSRQRCKRSFAAEKKTANRL